MKCGIKKIMNNIIIIHLHYQLKLLSFFTIIGSNFVTLSLYADGGAGSPIAGQYSGSIVPIAGHKVTVSISLFCLEPNLEQSCVASLFRIGNDSNAGIKYQTGVIGNCASGGIFESNWEIGGSGITCGKGNSVACIGCLVLQLTCHEVATGRPFVSETGLSIVGDCT